MSEQDQPEFTFWHLEAAACMWEHVVRELTRKRPLAELTTAKPAWLEYHDAYGMNALRETVIRHAPVIETHYREALANRYKGDFARDFVPKYMEDHVTRILT